MNSWYEVNTKKIEENGGRGLLNKHKRSPILLLSTVFPHFTWDPWKFNKVSKDFNDLQNQRQLLDSKAKELGIKDMGDWYNISSKV